MIPTDPTSSTDVFAAEYSPPPIVAPPLSVEGLPADPDEVSQDITVRRMSVRQFRELGFVHEINRLILHPCGIALEVEMDPATGEETLGGVWDCADDDEGVLLGADLLDPAKAASVAQIIEARGHLRAAALGFVIQPLPPETKQLNVTIKEFVASRVPGPGTWDEGEETPA